MPYKDELELIIDFKIADPYTLLTERIKTLENDNADKDRKITELKGIIDSQR